MDYQKCAESIIRHIGGLENVAHLEHCSTRLRFTLTDDQKVDLEALKSVPGVMGVVMTGQCQVIIGNEVVEVYQAVRKLGNFNDAAPNAQTVEKKKIGALVLDFIIGVFQPLIPAMAGVGVLKSLLLVCAMAGLLNKDGNTYNVLTSISDAVLYFLPMMVAMTAASKLGANKLVAMGAVGTLLLPKLTTLMSAKEGLTVFGLGITNITYSNQVFPAILCVLFLAVVEKAFTKISPKPIRIFFVPMMTFLITVPVTLLLLGPIGFKAGELFTTVILALHEHLGWFAIIILAACLPFMISIGMHKALIPYAVLQVGKTGFDALYLPASLAHNIAESGACFGVALRTKNQNTRATAISAGISALFGITEPALYGLTILHKRMLYSVLSGCVVGGAFIGIAAIKAFVLVGPGLASMTMYIDEKNSMNFIYAVIAFAISFVVAMVTGLIIWKEDQVTTPEESLAGENVVVSPMTGEMLELSAVKDEAFSTGALGAGVAIVPTTGEVYAPVDGTVHTVFASKHAIALVGEQGVEILIHVGMDTVKLEGKYFEPVVKTGDQVKAGDLLMKFDLQAIQAEGYDVTTPLTIPNGGEFEIEYSFSQTVAHGTPIMKLTAKA